MRVLYLTSFVLGDAGANAADIFPRLASRDDSFDKVIVADFPKNKHHIETRQGAEYLRLEWRRSWFRHAARIARKCKRERIDIVHIFYRQQNAILAIFLRLWLLALRCNTTILMDHRSVNLARGWRSQRKKLLNHVMQLCVQRLAGNPWAVETNHFKVFRPKHLIDLGYDELPSASSTAPETKPEEVNIWFIGSLKPRNRKSQFLLDVFQAITDRQSGHAKKIKVHVAGPTHPDQSQALKDIACVTYHGVLPRSHLYEKLRMHPGIGIAYMNREFHEYAPSLKFAEYAIMRFRILASDTIGLNTQAARMQLPNAVTFVDEVAAHWADAIHQAAYSYSGLEPAWNDAETWSYPSIFERQVVSTYREILEELQPATHGSILHVSHRPSHET